MLSEAKYEEPATPGLKVVTTLLNVWSGDDGPN